MAAPLLTSILAAASLQWGAVPVTKVVFEAPGHPAAYRLQRVFGVPEGSTLSRSEIRAGVQALLATGQVEDAVVDVEESDGGAIVHVRVQPVSRIRSVTVTGLPGGEAKRVRAALDLAIGAPFWVPGFEAGLERARQDLVDSGYPEARLTPDLRFGREMSDVAVEIQGDLGHPLTIRALEAPGLGLKPGEIWDVCRLEQGGRLTSANLEQARRRLASYLRREGFWEAEVRSPLVTAADGGATVKLEAARGPRYELDLEGWKLSRSLEAEALPFLRGEETFSEAALDSVVQQVLVYLQHDGRLLAKAKGEMADRGDTRVLKLTVDAGRRTPIVAVRFPGAHSVPEKDLAQKVGARKGRFWRWGGEAVDDETLAADSASVLATLRAAGFADARADDPRVVPSGRGVVIEFPVEEGVRRTVRVVAVEGAPPEVAVPPLPLVPRGPWSQGAEDQARAALETSVRDAGYPDATVTATHACNDGSCAETLRVEPGPRAVVDRVVVAGLVGTSPRVVEKVARLRPGDIAGPDVQLAAQRRLLGLGIFQSVNIHPIPDQDSGSKRGLVVDVSEGPTGAYALGLGYDTEQKAQVSLSWSELNLLGTGRSLTLDSRLSRLETRFQLTYREPQGLALLAFPTSISVYQTNQVFPSYEVFQRGFLMAFGDERKRPLRMLLRYGYQVVDNTAPPEILSDIERSQQNLHIATITPSITWDTRDDILVPHRGLYASAEWQHAFRLFRADAQYDLLNLQLSSYVPAAGGVLAFSLRAGGIEPRGTGNGEPDNLRVPVNVRFFAGGRATHRAFPVDLLGIPDQTLGCITGSDGRCQEPVSEVAIGGAGLAITNLEWRFPIYGIVGGTLFVDGGNVWPSWRAISARQARWGGGFGLRADTPVGPIRLEYGWKFRPETIIINGTPIEEKPGELFFSFGNAF